MKELFKHQVTGIEFLCQRKGVILADEMGLGKSRQAVVALGRVSSHVNVIICPASLKLNWEREIRAVYTEDVIFVAGQRGTAELGWERASWIVINYDQLSKWVGVLLDREFSLVGDEAHYIKGRSQRTKLFLMLASEAERVYLLTGTPILNRPIDLYNLLKAIRHPLSLTKKTGKDNWYGYAMKFCGAFRQTTSAGVSFLNVRGASNLDKLREEISDSFLRRMKSEVMDLPEKIIQEVPVEVSDSWRAKYDNAFDDYIKFLREHPMEGKNIDNVLLAKHIVELQKLKQVCSNAKLDTVVEDVVSAVESGEKVVIFTQYQKTLEDLCERISGKGIGVVSISGSMDQDERQQAVDDFQGNDRVMVFVGNMKAAGVGITLTASSNVFFADLDWTPAVHDQAMDRCHRIGQAGTVNVRYYVARETIEGDIMGMLANKRETIEKVLSGEASGEADGVADMVNRLSTRVRLVL